VLESQSSQAAQDPLQRTLSVKSGGENGPESESRGGAGPWVYPGSQWQPLGARRAALKSREGVCGVKVPPDSQSGTVLHCLGTGNPAGKKSRPSIESRSSNFADL